MNASTMRYMLAFASAAAALPGLPHPARAVDLPIAAVVGGSQQASAPNGAPLPFGGASRRVNRIRLLDEQKKRGTYPSLNHAIERAAA